MNARHSVRQTRADEPPKSPPAETGEPTNAEIYDAFGAGQALPNASVPRFNARDASAF
jgi:hypothetical protein